MKLVESMEEIRMKKTFRRKRLAAHLLDMTEDIFIIG